MELNKKQQVLLKKLPSIDHILELSKKEPTLKVFPGLFSFRRQERLLKS